MAPANNVPAEEPAKIPYFFNNICIASKASLSETLIASSITSRSQLLGIKSSPIPSTNHDPPSYF